MMAWLVLHPFVLHLAFLVVTAVLSLAWQKASGSPKFAAVIKILTALGLDVPQLVEGLGELFGVKDPGAKKPADPK